MDNQTGGSQPNGAGGGAIAMGITINQDKLNLKDLTPDPGTPLPPLVPLVNPVGRPTKYKPEYCSQVIGHMGQGYSVESFAGKVNVSKDSIYTWIKEYPDFSDAVDEGRAKSLLFWETIGINGTVGKPSYYFDEIEQKKVRTGNFNSQTYALHMANKHKWVSSKTDVTTDGEKLQSPTVVINTKE